MPEHVVPYAHRMTDAGQPNPSATRSHEGVRPESGDPLDPITAALLAAIEARRQSHTDIGVLTALQRAADYCTDQLQQRLDKVIADANAAQQLFETARAGGDKAQALRLFHEADAATRHAQTVGHQVEQALCDFAVAATQLTAPALERMHKAMQATQRLIDTADDY